MTDPKLVVALVTITHASDDGYQSTESFFSGEGNPVEGVLLGALQELTRLTALYGFAKKAKDKFDAMQATMADFHAARHDPASATEPVPNRPSTLAGASGSAAAENGSKAPESKGV